MLSVKKILKDTHFFRHYQQSSICPGPKHFFDHLEADLIDSNNNGGIRSTVVKTTISIYLSQFHIVQPNWKTCYIALDC